MVSFGLFGSAAPRVRRLQPQQIDMLSYAPQMPQVAPVEQRRPKFTAQSMMNEPAPAPAPAENASGQSPPLGMFGSSAPKPGKYQSSGDYQPGKRDWMKEIGSDPLGFFLTGTDGLSEQRDEAMAYAGQQAAAEERARKEAQLMDQARAAGIDPGGILAMSLNPTEFGKSYGTNYEAANIGAGDSRVVRGAGGARELITAPKFGVDGGYGYSQTPEGIEWQDQRGQNYAEATDAATLDETKRNNDMTNSRGWAGIGVDRDRLAMEKAKAEREAISGDPEFNAAQNARIYTDSMDAVDAAMKDQGRLDTIARTALQFIESAKDWNSQGEGWWNDLGQALSMDTTGLKQLTDTIAPLIREPGSGGNSDADVNMFKSSVVSINNPKEANVRFAKGAQALAARNKEFVSYLSDTIDPNDPKSRQNANKIWLAYTAENPLFDTNTGEVRTPPRFKDWLDAKTGNAPPVNSFAGRRVQSATAAVAPPPPVNDVSDLLEKYR
jgi:hypothetical protein